MPHSIGLLAGRYETRTTSTLHDDREEETSNNLQARITSFQCCASICSFYNPAGQIEGKLGYNFRCACSLYN